VRAARLAGIAAEWVGARWRWSRLRGPALERYRERRARAIVRLALERSPFYRAHWAGHDPDDWRSLPTVDKRGMMEHFGAFNTLGIPRDEAMETALRAERTRDFTPTVRGVTVGLSSGTSGHRGLFLASPREQAVWAGTILARALHGGFRREGWRVALFLRSNSNLYESTDGTLIRFRWFDLMTPPTEAVAALNAYRPHLLLGPPSLLGLLADARERGELRFAPERLVSVAEVLEPQDRERLEAVFGAPVHQVYQCTEGLLAVSCPAGSLHVQEDLVHLQLEPVGNGYVTPVVTDLRRVTQPIVRYRLNDLLRMDDAPCACGSPWRVIRSIDGRCDDLLAFEQADGGTRPFFPDTIRRMVLLADGGVEDYQAFQDRPGHLRVHLAVSDDAPFDGVARAVRASAESIVAGYGCRAPVVEVERGLVPVAPGAKRRRVRRLG